MRCSPSLLLLLSLRLPASLAAAAPNYKIVNATEFGKAFVAQRQDARTLSAALRLTLSDITAYLGSAPSSYRAYSDTRDASSGGATFLANAGGVALKGLVTCKVGQKGTRVAVVMIRADAPPNEFGRLLNPEAPNTPAAPASADGKAIATSHAPLRTYSFPDGTGTIGLAEGWSTNGESCLRMVQLQGPVNEGITMGASFSIVTPGARFRAPGALQLPGVRTLGRSHRCPCGTGWIGHCRRGLSGNCFGRGSLAAAAHCTRSKARGHRGG